MKQDITAKTLSRFGLLVGGAFAVIGVWPFLFHSAPLRLWALVLAVLLLLAAIACPRFLVPFYRGWMAVGHLLGWINTKVILGVLFYVVFTPAGLLRRLFGDDPLHREFEADAETYRVMRHPRPGTHMRHQF
jgi:uncharacterized membrane protein